MLSISSSFSRSRCSMSERSWVSAALDASNRVMASFKASLVSDSSADKPSLSFCSWTRIVVSSCTCRLSSLFWLCASRTASINTQHPTVSSTCLSAVNDIVDDNVRQTRWPHSLSSGQCRQATNCNSWSIPLKVDTNVVKLWKFIKAVYRHLDFNEVLYFVSDWPWVYNETHVTKTKNFKIRCIHFPKIRQYAAEL